MSDSKAVCTYKLVSAIALHNNVSRLAFGVVLAMDELSQYTIKAGLKVFFERVFSMRFISFKGNKGKSTKKTAAILNEVVQS